MTAIQTPPVSTEVSSTVLEDVIFPPSEIEREKNEKLAAKLRELNIDPDTL